MKFVEKDGTYRTEEETATDKFNADLIYQRMLNRWHDILCDDVKVNDNKLFQNKLYKAELYLKVINLQLSLLNNGSTFEISKVEIN